MLPRNSLLVASTHFFAMLLWFFSAVSLADEPPTQLKRFDGSGPWIRVTDESLLVRLRGEVIDESGAPVSGATMSLKLNSSEGSRIIVPDVRENTFEAWLPATGFNWYSLVLECRHGDDLAFRFVDRNQVRQATFDGMKVTLRKPVSSTQVIVTHAGKPVAGATVKVEMTYNRVARGSTDDDGSLDVAMYPGDQIRSLTAWTDDHRVGGYQFGRQPVRDNKSPTLPIELHTCRNQLIRMLDVDGNPIEGVEFQLQVATPAPFYNYLGIVGDANLRTNRSGEAAFEWFPDWPEVHRYVELKSDQWFVHEKDKPAEDALVVILKPRVQRKRVIGKVVGGRQSLAGLTVQLMSFQAEREDHYERLYATTDARGNFSADVLPGSTYSVSVSDPKFVSDYADVLAFDPQTNKPQPIVVTMQQAVTVKVTLTAGPDRIPIVNQSVNFRNDHSFTWMENQEQRSGRSGRAISVITDDDGIATAAMLPGTIEVSVYQPDWRASGHIEATADGDNLIELHRDLVDPRRVTGRLLVKDAANISVADCEVTVSSLDGNAQDLRMLRTKADGSFSLETIATRLGVFATTDDHRFAGAVVASDLSQSIDVTMHPTATVRGRLSDPDDNPVAGRAINVYATVRDPKQVQAANPVGIIVFPPSMRAAKRTATTNDDGEFVFEGLPCQVELTFYAEGQDWQLGKMNLQPGAEPPVTQWSLEHTVTDSQ